MAEWQERIDSTTVELYSIFPSCQFDMLDRYGIKKKLVNFESFGASSLNIFIYAFTSTSNWERYLNIREDIHLKIMKIVEENGSSFAFPSQSIYVEQMPDKNML